MSAADVFWNCICLGLPLTIMIALLYGLLYGFAAILRIPQSISQAYLEWWLHRGE
jgi:hypothetical protein